MSDSVRPRAEFRCYCCRLWLFVALVLFNSLCGTQCGYYLREIQQESMGCEVSRVRCGAHVATVQRTLTC